MPRFTISENRYTGRRVQLTNEGKITVTIMKRPLTDDQKKAVDEAHVDPLSKIQQIEALLAAGGKLDPDALKAILSQKVDFDALASEVA